MKPLVLFTAAVVLMLICLAGYKQDSISVPCSSTIPGNSAISDKNTCADTTEASEPEAAKSLVEPVNMSGKNMKFFFVSF